MKKRKKIKKKQDLNS